MTDPENSIWGYGGSDAKDVDLQWVIKDNLHPVIQALGYELNETITYSTQDPAARGVPYLHGFETTVNVIAVGGREDGGGNTEYVQELAVAVAEFPIQKSFFMNISRAYHDPGFATQQFFDMLRQASYYMFDLQSSSALAAEVEKLELKVYPNPAQEVVHVSFQAKSVQEARISLIDLSGRTVRSIQHMAKQGANTLTMNLENLNRGLYTLKIEADQEPILSKILIK